MLEEFDMDASIMNYEITVRRFELADCQAVVEVYRGEQGWYNNLDGCRDMFSRGQRCKLYQAVAERGGVVLGLAEWLFDRDEGGAYLYLSELQVRSDSQRQKIGRALIADGIEFARAHGASRVLTMPEIESGSKHFYAKCGFVNEDSTNALTIPSTADAQPSRVYTQADSVPLTVLERPFVFGAAQWSPRHMYNVCNDKPFPSDPYEHIAFWADNGDYIQFRYKRGHAMPLGWLAEPSAVCITDALALASTLGIQSVDFEFYAKFTPLFTVFGAVEQSQITMSLTI
jgi:GNAT superfamily N-acetyltransferase